MPEDAPPNGGAPGPRARVLEMQTKLHRWTVADPGRRFDDLFNFVHDPATLLVAFDRVAGNRGARTPGVDGLTATDVEESIGVPGFLNDLRAALKDGSFRPLPVRERSIPKPGGSGKVRKLGIPTIADRVVQAALKLVLEPIFEADFKPVSYGFRPRRRAQDAIAEIHYFGTRGYRWVLDADIEACFDSIDHTALMDRVRHRVKDKRVLMLVKAFLKAGILTELGETKTVSYMVSWWLCWAWGVDGGDGSFRTACGRSRSRCCRRRGRGRKGAGSRTSMMRRSSPRSSTCWSAAAPGGHCRRASEHRSRPCTAASPSGLARGSGDGCIRRSSSSWTSGT